MRISTSTIKKTLLPQQKKKVEQIPASSPNKINISPLASGDQISSLSRHIELHGVPGLSLREDLRAAKKQSQDISTSA